MLPTELLLCSIEQTCAILNKSRAEVYLEIGRGVLDARKDGRRTKITMQSIRRRADELPKAPIKPEAPGRKHTRREPVDTTETRIA